MYRLKLNRGGAISTMAAGGGLALIGKLIRLSDLGLYGFFYQALSWWQEADFSFYEGSMMVNSWIYLSYIHRKE